MWLNIYTLVTVVSAIILTAFGFQLCGVDISRKKETRKLRTSRAILTASYFILAGATVAELLVNREGDPKIIATLTIATAAYQSLLFTATLFIFICPLYVTRRRVWTQVGIVTAAVALFMPVALATDIRWIFPVALAVYAGQLTYYTWLFRRKYAESLAQLEDYYDEEQDSRLRWTKFGFYAALAVGVAASVSMWLPPMAYNLFTVGYVVFYGWFSSRFSNYAAKVNYYLPALTEQPEIKPEPEQPSVPEVAATELSDAERWEKTERLRVTLEHWVADRGYAVQEDRREQIARELGTTPNFLRWYFREQMSQDFLSWRVGLRIEYAKELLSEELGISMNELAQKVGFNTRGNFYTYFRKVMGETPTEYLNRIKLKNRTES